MPQLTPSLIGFLTAAAFSFPVAADPIAPPDLLGSWQGAYQVVSPTNQFGPGPRIDSSEWLLNITTQEGHLFWAESNWRSEGATDWVRNEATGAIAMDGSGEISMLQSAPDPEVGVNAIIDATFVEGALYVRFRSLTTGATYSAILTRQAD